MNPALCGCAPHGVPHCLTIKCLLDVYAARWIQSIMLPVYVVLLDVTCNQKECVQASGSLQNLSYLTDHHVRWSCNGPLMPVLPPLTQLPLWVPVCLWPVWYWAGEDCVWEECEAFQPPLWWCLLVRQTWGQHCSRRDATVHKVYEVLLLRFQLSVVGC